MPAPWIALLTIALLWFSAFEAESAHNGHDNLRAEGKPAAAPRLGDLPAAERARAACVILGTCARTSGRPIGTICRLNGPCIPASKAWLADGPLASAPGAPRAFETLAPTVAVPLPPTVFAFLAGLGCFTLVFRRRRPRQTN